MGLIETILIGGVTINQSLTNLPGERKVILTKPHGDMIRTVYNYLKRHGGGTLIVLESDIADVQTKKALCQTMRTAKADNINMGVFWSVKSKTNLQED